jgi:hypothetical protein
MNMKQPEQSTTNTDYPIVVTKPVLIGAALALFLISFFVIGVNPKPEWGKFWMIRPLVIVPLAGALGGAFFYFMDRQRYLKGWNKTLVRLITLVICLFILWVGTVLGLDGTLWD